MRGRHDRDRIAPAIESGSTREARTIVCVTLTDGSSANAGEADQRTDGAQPYTVRFAEAVYVLHAFQKKSRRGVATPKTELDLIRARLARAKEDYEQWQRNR